MQTVTADELYGSSGDFLDALEQMDLRYVVETRKHGIVFTAEPATLPGKLSPARHGRGTRLLPLWAHCNLSSRILACRESERHFPSEPPSRISAMSIMTGLSGNEMYCLHLKGLSPGELVVGNSVYSLGFVGGIGAGLKSAFGGEVTQITQIIHEGRQQSYARMVEEAQQRGGAGITGVTSELRAFHGNIEFLSVASCVHAAGPTDGKTPLLHQRRWAGTLLPAGRRLFAAGNSSSATWPIPRASAAGCWAA